MEYILSFDSSKFSQLVEPPMAHISASIGHYIFLLGGYGISNEDDIRTIMTFDKTTILYYNVLIEELDTIECSYDMESINSFPTEFFCSSGMACCSFENKIFLFGGYSLSKQEAGNALYYIEIYKDMKSSETLDIKSFIDYKPNARLKFLAGSHDGMEEETHLNYPSYRDKASLVYWNKNLIVFGGYGSNFHRTENQENDPGHNFISVNGEYIPGSGNRGWTNQLLIFSMNLKKWLNPVTYGSIPCPRAAHCAAISGCKMIIFGGRLGVKNTYATIRSNQFYYLDLITFHWTKLILNDSSIIGRSWTTLTPISERTFFIIGGFSGENVPLSDAYVVTVDKDWNVGLVTEKQRCFQQAFWDPFIDKNSWNTKDNFFPVSRMWHSASLAPDGLIYIIGGCRNNLIFQVERIQSTVERIRPEPQTLYKTCLWKMIKINPVINREKVPNRLFNDLLCLSI